MELRRKSIVLKIEELDLQNTLFMLRHCRGDKFFLLKDEILDKIDNLETEFDAAISEKKRQLTGEQLRAYRKLLEEADLIEDGLYKNERVRSVELFEMQTHVIISKSIRRAICVLKHPEKDEKFIAEIARRYLDSREGQAKALKSITTLNKMGGILDEFDIEKIVAGAKQSIKDIFES